MKTIESLRRELDDLISKHSMGLHARAIHDLAHPCVRMKPTRVSQDALAPLDSRLGGSPHLPLDFEWPFWNGLPLGHLATVRLSEASPHDPTGALPTRGLLYFWFELSQQPWGFESEDAGSFRVDFIPDENTTLRTQTIPLDRAPKDADLSLIGHMHCRPCRASFEAGLTLPDSEWVELYAPHASRLAESDAYWEVVCSLRWRQRPENHLLGLPSVHQGPMEQECEEMFHAINALQMSGYDELTPDELAAEDGDWRLLCQIDTDEDGPGWMWGDCGALYFWIRERELRNLDFSRVWGILQCG